MRFGEALTLKRRHVAWRREEETQRVFIYSAIRAPLEVNRL